MRLDSVRRVILDESSSGETEYCNQSNVREIDYFDGNGIVERLEIMLDGRTPLHHFEAGSVAAPLYRDKGIFPYMWLFHGAVVHILFL
ncbi:hypothetical protein AVEN_211542-1 [Araneus ventricosus]|uniref:Uncharacterized protein n=1 Tax=Araneus ventricosus TaxID=182803 RepID=A0A4Y2PAJ0_ARAVE|nr:hypothetical protein AVEN_211542-1 [Araneus ventricosus]